MKMNKYIITTLSIVLVFTLIASATTNNPFVSKQLIKSQYGSLGEFFSVGDRLYKLTYDSGSIEYKLERTTLLKPAFITSISSTLSVPINGYIDVPITITGISSTMDGQAAHDHVIRVYDSADTLVTNRQYNVNSGKTYSATLQLGTKSTAGVYTYTVKETIWLKLTLPTGESNYIETRGDTAYVTVTVGTPSPTSTTPTPTTTSTTPAPTSSGNCADGTSNNACSSQKPLYCYYGTLINKASQCGCPSGQTPSGDSCIVAEQKCSDGTAYNTCSANKPKYCYYGTLTDKASACGCPSGSTISGDICIGTLTPIVTITPVTTTPGGDQCLTGYVYNPSTGECVKIQTSDGFDSTTAIIVIIGLVITAYIILRRKK